ncbi:MAG TPA: GNAT family N-acetyltransferase [Ktedonobacterales bacterium]|jgi:GNAT superfamily N-acetyltransferase
MTTYRFSNTLGYTQPQLAEMFNASFSGYYFPMALTAEMSAGFARVYQIDANCSVVMHDEQGAFVGMARMGVRGARGWCGGFGITPEFRGTGASRLLAAQMIQVARESGLTTLQLEVLTQNIKAIKLYERAGFVAARRLIGIEVDTAALPDAFPSLQVKAVAPATLFPGLYEGYQPDWERELPSLMTMRAEAVAAAGADGQLNGLIFRPGGRGANNEKIQIQAAILQSDLTNADLAALLRAAAGDAAGIQVYNEPEDSPFLARCRDLGFTEFFSQHEMFLTL